MLPRAAAPCLSTLSPCPGLGIVPRWGGFLVSAIADQPPGGRLTTFRNVA